ncbi:MAG: hypothetical protein EOO59_14200 [Hymenobacter sp.]|nr:MAG: hypothetical protein EOO59_14200 [Hymenobacter sp.]
MRFSFGLLAGSLALIALSAAPNAAVVPGRSLGNVTLGADASSLAALGPPSTSDAAMQKAWVTWYGARPAGGGPRTQLDVYTAPANNDVDHHTVQVVRATSPWFHVANGLRVGTSLRAIRAAYGALPLVATYRLATGPRYLYDDARRGIAFELDGQASGSRCRALLVHAPGQAGKPVFSMMATYLGQLPKP